LKSYTLALSTAGRQLNLSFTPSARKEAGERIRVMVMTTAVGLQVN